TSLGSENGIIGCSMLLSASLSTWHKWLLYVVVSFTVDLGVARSLCACCLCCSDDDDTLLPKNCCILSSNVITFSSDDYALLFTAHSSPWPISWLGSHTDNVNAAVADSG
ncbi:hypothetical protein Tco_1188277, partial [Tanacetum coccineum]